jgi:hypothetical protein
MMTLFKALYKKRPARLGSNAGLSDYFLPDIY